MLSSGNLSYLPSMEINNELSKPTSANGTLNKNDEPEDLFRALEQKMDWNGDLMSRYRGFWFDLDTFRALLTFQTHFRAKDTDIIVASAPKSGTTWLKALIFSIVNRHRYVASESPLLSFNPHDLVPFFELNLYKNIGENSVMSSFYPDSCPKQPSYLDWCPELFKIGTVHRIALTDGSDLEQLKTPIEIGRLKTQVEIGGPHDFDTKNVMNPRIFSTHIPYQLLPNSILNSKCKIVYIGRNPLDNFISRWSFSVQNQFGTFSKPLPMEESFELFCEGITFCGPFWDHVLGYWHASLKSPQKILFIKYEDLKKDIISSVKKIASFLDCPFSSDEERKGMVEEITRMCSFEKLKNLEVNKNGEWHGPSFKVKKSSFFRKGEVGDWVNHLNPSMVLRLQKMMEEKFGKAGLSFDLG